jgi:tetratricopeptide (TPR) repeat protein
LLVAALFAVHPLHVESVAWITERKDVLSTFFGFLALWAYVHYASQPSPLRYAQVMLAMALSLMAKPMFVTLPYLLLLFDYWPLRRWAWAAPGAKPSPKRSIGAAAPASMRWLFAEKIPLMLLSAASCAVTLAAQSGGGAVRSLDVVPLPTRVANAFVAYADYIGKMLWPRSLAILYPYNRIRLSDWHVLTAALLLLVLTAAFAAQARRRPYLIVGWLWYLGTLVPVIGLVQVGEQAMADRYTYVPLVGLSIVLVWGAADLATLLRLPRVPARILAATALALCMITSWRQAGYWRGDVDLWDHAVQVTDSNVTARSKLGMALAQTGKVDQALAQFDAALEIDPQDATTLCNMGVTLFKTGQEDRAVKYFQSSLSANPDVFEAHYNLGVILSRHQKPEEARRHYEEALRIKPDSENVHINLGLDYLQQRQVETAKRHFEAAVRINPRLAVAHVYLGVALAWEGRDDAAIQCYRQALRLNPASAQAYNNLGLALARTGNLSEGAQCCGQAVALEPASVKYRCNWAYLLFETGQEAQARGQYREALGKDPQWPFKARASAWLMSTSPDAHLRSAAESLQLAKQACQAIDSPRAYFLEALGAAYAEGARFEEAGRTVRTALQLAAEAKQQELVPRLQEMLRRFENHQPFREESRDGRAPSPDRESNQG